MAIAALLKADLSYIFRDHAMWWGGGRSCWYLDVWIHILSTICCYGSHMAKQIVMPCLDSSWKVWLVGWSYSKLHCLWLRLWLWLWLCLLSVVSRCRWTVTCLGWQSTVTRSTELRNLSIVSATSTHTQNLSSASRSSTSPLTSRKFVVSYELTHDILQYDHFPETI